MPNPDAQLLQRWRDRADPQAFRSLVDTYANLVYAAALRVLNNPADAEDVTQESFLALAQHPRADRSLAAWLHRVATNNALNLHRTRARRQRREHTWTQEQPPMHTPTWDDIREHLDAAINELPETDRALLIGHYLQGQTHEQLAQTLGLTRTAVTKRISRTVDRLRDQLKKRGVPIAAPALAGMLAANTSAAAPAGLLAKLAEIGLVGPLSTGAKMAESARMAGGAQAMKKGLLLIAGIVVVAGLIWVLVSSKGLDERNTEPLASRAEEQPTAIEDVDDSPTLATVAPTETSDFELPVQIAQVENDPTAETPLSITGVVLDADTGRGVGGVPVYYLKVYEDTRLVSGIKSERPSIQLLVTDMSKVPDDVEFRHLGKTRFTDDNRNISERHVVEVFYSSSVVSGPSGDFAVTSLAPGNYFFATGATPEYKASDPRNVFELSEDEVNFVQIEIKKAGTLEGRVLLNGEPLPNTDVLIISYPRGPRLNTSTDSEGRYRIEGAETFEGNVRGEITLADGTNRESLIVTTKIEPGKTTTVDFDFAAGSATIEGRVYRASDNAPLPCGLNLLWQYADGERANRDRVEVRTDEDGYFIVENVLSGSVLVEAFPDFAGTLKHRKRIEVSDGETARVDFPFEQTYITVNVSNIPESRTQAVLALPGDYDVPSPMTSWEQLMQIEDDMLCVGFIQDGRGHLNGLTPGRYTIVASALPTGPYFQDYIALGDEYLAKVRRVATTIDLTEDNPNLTIHLDFDE